MSLGVVLNTYKRKDYFKIQLEAVLSQTVKPDKLVAHRNDDWSDDIFEGLDWVKSGKNAGVYRRFCLGLDLETDYVLFFDDDTIPGSNYVANLIKHHDEEPGLYCAAGFKINHRNYNDRQVFGWANPQKCRSKVRVDWPGHAWFMHKSILIHSYDLPRYPDSNLCGEDMRLAYATQDLGLKSYIAAYSEDVSTWGSTSGNKGTDSAATFRLPNQKQNMHNAMTFYRKCGWKFMSEL